MCDCSSEGAALGIMINGGKEMFEGIKNFFGGTGKNMMDLERFRSTVGIESVIS